MVPLGVVALAFSALVAFAAATEVHQCAGARFEKLSEHVQLSPCKNIPCRLKKGTDQHITIHFEPESDIAVLKNEVYADFLGVPVPFIGVDGQSICDKLFTETDEKASCPVKAGNKYVYKDTFPVYSFYPSVTLKVHWALKNGTKNLICFEVPARIA